MAVSKVTWWTQLIFVGKKIFIKNQCLAFAGSYKWLYENAACL